MTKRVSAPLLHRQNRLLFLRRKSYCLLRHSLFESQAEPSTRVFCHRRRSLQYWVPRPVSWPKLPTLAFYHHRLRPLVFDYHSILPEFSTPSSLRQSPPEVVLREPWVRQSETCRSFVQ